MRWFESLSISNCGVFLKCIFLIYFIVVAKCIDHLDDDYIELSSKNFLKQFHSTCDKYPFVKKYQDMLRSPPDKYLLFMYTEEKDGTMVTGGFGDRLAGLVTAAAYSVRTNRTLIIHGDEPLKTYFGPIPVDDKKFGWNDLSWSNWKDDYKQSSEVLGCVNPTNPICADGIQRKMSATEVMSKNFLVGMLEACLKLPDVYCA